VSAGRRGAPRAITLDLDDTLWPVWPAIELAEAALQQWLEERCPVVGQRYPLAGMRRLRDEIATERPDLAHDYSAQRLLSLQRALAACGEREALAEEGFEVFFAARNRVELFEDAEASLLRMAAHVPLVALTNGNADLARIGLDHHFAFCVCARDFGRAKPDPGIFLSACERLGLAPAEVLHVGDHPDHDIIGAHRAGMRTAWLNRGALEWPHADLPEIAVRDLHQLADWLDRLHAGTAADD
jgi:HAD superfamily hydrolase (TIGR01549 family)